MKYFVHDLDTDRICPQDGFLSRDEAKRHCRTYRFYSERGRYCKLKVIDENEKAEVEARRARFSPHADPL